MTCVTLENTLFSWKHSKENPGLIGIEDVSWSVRLQESRQQNCSSRFYHVLIYCCCCATHSAENNAVASLEAIKPAATSQIFVVFEFFCKLIGLFIEQRSIDRNILRSSDMKPFQQCPCRLQYEAVF